MFDSNPQLMHQAFDSMVMHLRSLQDRHGPKTGTTASIREMQEWQPLADDLHRIGLEKRQSDAWLSWVSMRDGQARPHRIRLLHPMERELITLDAFDDLLELSRLGVLSPLQVENVIENCAYMPSLPVGKDQVRKLALRIFAEQFQSQGFGPSH
jgi:hypothetical protein